MEIHDVRAEALRLSGKDRARLAETLLLSLDESADDRAQGLWLDEAQRRYRAYEKGKDKAVPAERVPQRPGENSVRPALFLVEA